MDLSAFRELFPALERFVWLDTPTAPPAARPVSDALIGAERDWAEGTFSWRAWEAEAEATRTLFAGLVGGAPDTIALLPSLAEAAATVAASLPIGGLVVGEQEFQSNLFPWLALEAQGWTVTQVRFRGGVLRTDDVVAAIDDRTVLVAISEVQSSSGARVHVPRIAERSREVGARLFLNLTQMLGALRFDVSDVRPDFVATHGYKWLLAPRGAAWLHVRPDRLAELRPLAPSWKSQRDPHAAYYGGPLDLAPDARRLDASLAWFSWVGARAALDVVRSLDAARVQTHCLQLAASFRRELEARRFRVVPQEAPSQIVAVAVADPDGVKRRLAERRVRAAVRGGFVRFGFHGYNVEADVEAALDALGRSP